MSWDTDMAKVLKSCANQDISLFHVGTVQSTSPLVISIMGGEVMLDSSNTVRVNGNYTAEDTDTDPSGSLTTEQKPAELAEFVTGDAVAVVGWQKYILLGKVVDI